MACLSSCQVRGVRTDRKDDPALRAVDSSCNAVFVAFNNCNAVPGKRQLFLRLMRELCHSCGTEQRRAGVVKAFTKAAQ